MSTLTSIISRLRMRHLRLLIALHEHGTVQKAAESVALTQPGATKALNEIEAMLDVQLFQRTHKGLETTDMGLCAVRYARLINTDLAHFHEELESMQQGRGGRLAVGLIMGAVPLISAALSRVRSLQPAISIEIVEDTSARLLNLLDRGRLDAAICRSRVNQRPHLYTSLDIHEEELAVICHPDNPLAQRSALTLIDLANTSWIVYPANMPMRLLLEREFHEAKIPFPLYPIETASAFTSISMLRHDRASVALMSVDASTPFVDAGMVYRLPIRLRSRSEPYELVTRKGASLSPASQLFMKEVALVGNLNVDADTHIEELRGNS
ncbi:MULTISPECIES: LysR family transcriptional regulator [Halomonadaceae]|uniref:LysR family transcriptional regulator n=1 Tax=Halomonadaceae TaxID=28256 RepID=UPI000C31CBD1|nr:LysR family transcriptional regulator [Halomonas sp. MES3-P3E]PKG50576.1 LysR family transcriptional regulator [Halomonas sp. MES3-P3E]